MYSLPDDILKETLDHSASRISARWRSFARDFATFSAALFYRRGYGANATSCQTWDCTRASTERTAS